MDRKMVSPKFHSRNGVLWWASFVPEAWEFILIFLFLRWILILINTYMLCRCLCLKKYSVKHLSSLLKFCKIFLNPTKVVAHFISFSFTFYPFVSFHLFQVPNLRWISVFVCHCLRGNVLNCFLWCSVLFFAQRVRECFNHKWIYKRNTFTFDGSFVICTYAYVRKPEIAETTECELWDTQPRKRLDIIGFSI